MAQVEDFTYDPVQFPGSISGGRDVKNFIFILMAALLAGCGGGDGDDSDVPASSSILGHWDVVTLGMPADPDKYVPDPDVEFYFEFTGPHEASGTFHYLTLFIDDPNDPGASIGVPSPLGGDVYGDFTNYPDERFVVLEITWCDHWGDCGGNVYFDYVVTSDALRLEGYADLNTSRMVFSCEK